MARLEQERACFALDKVRDIERRPEIRAKYLTQVKSLPSLILGGGLGQAAAMLLADKEVAPHILYEHLSAWLVGKRRFYSGEDDDLLGLITKGTRGAYLAAQEEALAFLVWLKRFADAFLRSSQDKVEVMN